MSTHRPCTSGLMATATAAKQITANCMEIAGGGGESISLRPVPDRQLITALQHVPCHRATHPTQSEKSDSHVHMPHPLGSPHRPAERRIPA